MSKSKIILPIFQGWEFVHRFFERITSFFVSERTICSWKRVNRSRRSFVMSNLSKLLKVALFKTWWERFAHNRSFVKSYWAVSIEQQEQFALAALYKRVIKIEIDFLTVVARANRFQLLFNLSDLEQTSKKRLCKRANSQPWYFWRRKEILNKF